MVNANLCKFGKSFETDFGLNLDTLKKKCLQLVQNTFMPRHFLIS